VTWSLLGEVAARVCLGFGAPHAEQSGIAGKTGSP
jgi:hypothetical protein